MVELGGRLERSVEALLAAPGHPTLLLVELDVGPVGEQPHRVRELHVVDLHHEAEYVAAQPAAEAVPQLSGRIDLERGRLLPVERTQPPEQPALGLEQDSLVDERDEVGGVADPRDVFICDATHERPSPE